MRTFYFFTISSGPGSPLNLQGSIRHSSSSLSSHTSSEAGNLHIMTDGLMGEHPEDPLHMQVRVMTKSHTAAMAAEVNTFVLHILHDKCPKMFFY